MDQRLWEKCKEFHGHECGGLAIGYRAALYARELLQLQRSEDEEIVCVTENDACGVDAIQVILGCSVGKGNLLFHLRGKQAFSFYDRGSGKSLRLVLKDMPEEIERGKTLEYYKTCPAEEMFAVKPATISLPEPAKIFGSFKCACCGETTGANWIRMLGEKKVCLDCYQVYDRFNV